MRVAIFIFAFLYFMTPVMAQSRPDSMPVYPGCETAKEKMPCLKEKLLDFIAGNFNQDILFSIKDSSSVQMLITFIIDTDGSLTEIHINSPYDSLNTEMQRVLSKLPKIIPAKKGQTPVTMQYQLPVSFDIKK